MSAALRKKIMSGNGVPPSILQLEEFWMHIRKRTGVWSEDALGTENMPEIVIRRVVSGHEVKATFESEVSFAYPLNAAPGLCGIVMDPVCVSSCAARRMKETRDSFTGASQLFLKLLCEDSAGTLWTSVAKDLDRHQTGFSVTPTSDLSTVAGQMSAESRYLEVALTIPFEEDAASLRLYFHLDYVLEYIRNFRKNSEVRKVEFCQHSPDTLRKSVQTSMISIEAILDRFDMTVGECSRLEVGQVLPLPEAETKRLIVSAETINGNLEIGSGELGVWKHNRALKLTAPILDSFVSNLAGL